MKPFACDLPAPAKHAKASSAPTLQQLKRIFWVTKTPEPYRLLGRSASNGVPADAEGCGNALTAGSAALVRAGLAACRVPTRAAAAARVASVGALDPSCIACT